MILLDTLFSDKLTAERQPVFSVRYPLGAEDDNASTYGFLAPSFLFWNQLLAVRAIVRSLCDVDNSELLRRRSNYLPSCLSSSTLFLLPISPIIPFTVFLSTLADFVDSGSCRGHPFYPHLPRDRPTPWDTPKLPRWIRRRDSYLPDLSVLHHIRPGSPKQDP